MAGINSVLDSVPQLDDEIAELESSFTGLYLKYKDLCSQHRPHGNTVGFSRAAAKYLYAPRYPELLRPSSEIRDDRSALIQQMAQLPEWPPPPRLLAETIRLEVESAAVPRHGLEACRARLYNSFLRRKDALQGERTMIMERLHRYALDWNTISHISERLRARQRRLQQDIEASESRLRRLRPLDRINAPQERPVAKSTTGEDLFSKCTAYEDSTLSCIYRGDIVVILRENIYEDRATRMLRRFLQRMQHLTVSHRKDIWRKTLQLQAASSEITLGAQCEAPLPLLALSAEKLEHMLKELSQQVGIRENLLSDEGHTFAYAVSLQFPKIFNRQRAGMLFTPYPEAPSEAFLSSMRASVEGPSSYLLGQSGSEDARGEAPKGNDEFSPSRLGRGVSGDDQGGPFLKDSEWVSFVVLQPRVDRYVTEQRALLRHPDKTSDSSGPSAEVSSLTGNARRATVPDKLPVSRNTLLNSKQEKHAPRPTAGLALGAYEVHETDITLPGELNLLKETDGKEMRTSLCARASKTATLALPPMTGQTGTPAQRASSSRSGAASPEGEPVVQSRDLAFSMPPEHVIQSYYLLRYLRSQELRQQLLHLLNVYRFVQRKVSHAILAQQVAPNGDLSTADSHSSAPRSDSKSSAATRRDLHCQAHDAPSMPKVNSLHPFKLPKDAHSALDILSGSERLSVRAGRTLVIDAHGLEIMHQVAQQDLSLIESEILEIGSHFIRRAEQDKEENTPAHQNHHQALKVDRGSVVYDLLQEEVQLHQAKWELLAPYLEIFEHTVDPAGRHTLAQRIVDVMAQRPRLDLDAGYFTEAYSSCISAIEERARLLRITLDHQIRTEKRLAIDMASCTEQFGDDKVLGGIGEEDDMKDPQLQLNTGLSHPNEGLPGCVRAGLAVQLVPTVSGDCKDTDLLDFYHSASLAWQVDVLVENLHGNFCETFEPHVRCHALSARACAMIVAAEWKRELYNNPVHLYTASSTRTDIFGYETMEDPACLMLLVEDAMQGTRGIFAPDGQPSSFRTGLSVEEAELRNEFSYLDAYPHDERTLIMYSNLLEHVITRRLLTDVVLELQFLESSLADQARTVGTDVAFRHEPINEFTEFSATDRKSAVAESQDEVKSLLLAGDIDLEFGKLDLSKGRTVILYCSDLRLRELRVLYQHELANRWLYVTCGMHNAMVADSIMKKQVAHEVGQKDWQPDLKADPGIQLLKRLRLTSSLSPSVATSIAPVSSAPVAPSASDFQRLGQICQFPGVLKSPVRLGMSQVFRERSRDLKQHLQNRSSDARGQLLRCFKTRLLSHGSLFIAEAACDLAVRLQAAQAAMESQRIVSLLPTDFSPFKFSTAAHPRVFVEANGSLGSIFVVPRATELLAMRGTSQYPPDVGRAILEADHLLPSIFSESSKAVVALPVLPLNYSGPSYISLQLLRTLTPLVSIIFFWSSLGSDRHVVLRLHHAVASADPCEQGSACKAAKAVINADLVDAPSQADDIDQESPPRDPVQMTWDAWEDMRIDFMNLKGQLRSLKDLSIETVQVFLRERLRHAAWRTSILVRQGLYDALGQDAVDVAAEMRRWVRYLDGYPIDGAGQLFVADPQSKPPTSIKERSQGEREAKAADLVKHLTLVRMPTMQDTTSFRYVSLPGNNPESFSYLGYPKPLAAQHSYFPMFVHALIATHGLEDDLQHAAVSHSTGAYLQTPLPFHGGIPWQFPSLPLEAMTRGLCFLPQSGRQAVAEVHLHLEMKLETYCDVREVKLDHSASLDAEGELSRTLLTFSRLREVVLCAQLQAAPPVCFDDVHAMDAFYCEIMSRGNATVDESPESETGEALEQENGAAVPTAPSDGAVVPAVSAEEQDALTMAAHATSSIKEEMRSAYDGITRLIGELHKVLLTFSIVTLEQEHGALSHHCSSHGHSERAGNASGSSGFVENVKSEAVATFNRIRMRGTRVRTHGKPVSDHSLEAYVIREHDLEECTEELGHRVLQWALGAVDSQAARARSCVAEKAASLKQLELHAWEHQWSAITKDVSFESDVAAAVADRGQGQLFEVDRLHRVLNELAAAGFEMEYRLNAEIRHTVLGEMATLEKQLVEANSRNCEYLASMKSCVKEEVSDLRQQILKKLTEMSLSNFVLRQKLEGLQEDTAEPVNGGTRQSQCHSNAAGDGMSELQREGLTPLKGIVVSESGRSSSQVDIEGNHEDINALRRAYARVQTSYRLKFQNLRQDYEQQIQAFTTTLSSNSDLWERASEVKERELIAADELNRSQRHVSAATESIERISGQASKEAETAARLGAWKDHAHEWLDTLNREEKKYQREGDNIDVKLLAYRIQKLDTEITQLDLGDRTQDRFNLEKTQSKTQTKTLKRSLGIEDSLTKKALAKTALIRKELECGDLVDKDSLVGILCDEYRGISQQLADVEQKNMVLRARLQQATNTAGADDSTEQKIIKDADATEFEENMCYTVGFMKCTQAPWYRNPVDSARGGSGRASAMTPRGGKASGTTPRGAPVLPRQTPRGAPEAGTTPPPKAAVHWTSSKHDSSQIFAGIRSNLDAPPPARKQGLALTVGEKLPAIQAQSQRITTSQPSASGTPENGRYSEATGSNVAQRRPSALSR